VEARGMSAQGAGWRLGGTPVLLYHAVGDAGLGARERRYQVPLDGFEAHLSVLAASGRQVHSLAEVWAGVGEAAPAAALTVDDGRETDYRLILPRLLDRGWPADFFVNPGTLGRPGYLTWPQAREMAEAGMGVQSHGYDHATFWGLSRAALRRQIGDSRRALEDGTGRRVSFLAAPFGHLTDPVVEVALEEGYRAVCTSWSWPARPRRKTVGRVAMYATTSSDGLARVLEGRLLPYAGRALRAAVVYPPKRIVVALQPARLGAAVEHRA
jgi:peptidoglycan/xylan/chitin deacetylase (PgdA/CDA1 family)